MTGASVLGFLGVSYNQQGCTKYEHVIHERKCLVDRNIEQFQDSTEWVQWTVLGWGVLVAVGPGGPFEERKTWRRLRLESPTRQQPALGTHQGIRWASLPS